MASSILQLLWNHRFNKSKKIFFYSSNQLVSHWTYSEVLKLALDYSLAFSHLPKGAPVALTTSTGPDFLGAFLGCQLAGLIPVPYLSPETLILQRSHNHLLDFLKKASIQTIVTNLNRLQQDLPDHQVILCEQIDHNQRPIESLNFNHLIKEFSIQYSSGSTSEPKGVVLTHEAVMQNLEQMKKALKVTQSDRLSSWLPLFHDMGLIGGLMAPIYNQVEAHLTSPSDFIRSPISWLESVSQTASTILIGPDFMYRKLASAAAKKPLIGSLKSLRICMSGSEPVLKETCENFVQTFQSNELQPHVMLPVYGMAEAVLGVTFPAISAPIEISNLNHVSCGKPLESTKIEIRNEKDRVCGDYEEGQIFLKGPHITREIRGGILRGPEEFLATGDLGYWVNQNLYLTGRIKDIIIIRGQKIHNLDLEKQIQNILSPGASRIGIVEHQQRLIVAVETSKPPIPDKQKMALQLIRSIDSELEAEFYYLPKGFLPRTSSGKLKRHQILKDYQVGGLRASRFTQLRFRFQSGIKKIQAFSYLKNLEFKKPLETDPLFDLIQFQIHKHKPGLKIKPETVILDLGLDSVQTVELLTEIEKEFGTISLMAFYEFKTLADIHKFLSSRL